MRGALYILGGLYILGWESGALDALHAWLTTGGAAIHFGGTARIERASAAMEQDKDHPTDFADLSVFMVAEVLKTRQASTLDLHDFSASRIKWGHPCHGVEIV